MITRIQGKERENELNKEMVIYNRKDITSREGKRKRNKVGSHFEGKVRNAC
jgi:hypothetical protein